MSRIVVPAVTVFSAVGLAASQALADQPKPWGIWMQEAASPTMHQITALNTTVTAIILVVLALVFVLLGYVAIRFHASRNPVPAKWTHNTSLEVAWTLLPVLILVAIAFPSFHLLFAMDRAKDADMTLKVTGHQWYWTYSYPDQNISFDANMVQDSETQAARHRQSHRAARRYHGAHPDDGRRRHPQLVGAVAGRQDRRLSRTPQRDLGEDRQAGDLFRPMFATVRHQSRLHADRGRGGLQGAIRHLAARPNQTIVFVDRPGQRRRRPPSTGLAFT
jgi:hypothetical protein